MRDASVGVTGIVTPRLEYAVDKVAGFAPRGATLYASWEGYPCRPVVHMYVGTSRVGTFDELARLVDGYDRAGLVA